MTLASRGSVQVASFRWSNSSRRELIAVNKMIQNASDLAKPK